MPKYGQNPFNYQSVDWSSDVEGFRRMISNAMCPAPDIDYSDPNFVPGEEIHNGIKGRIIHHVWTPYEVEK